MCLLSEETKNYTRWEVRDARWFEHRSLLVHRPPCEGSTASLVNLLSGLWGEVRDSSSAQLLFRVWTRIQVLPPFQGCKPMMLGWEKGKQGKEECEDLWGGQLSTRSHEKTDCSGWHVLWRYCRENPCLGALYQVRDILAAWLLPSPASHWQGVPWAEVTPLHFWVTALGCSESHIPCFMYHFIQVPYIEMWRCQ